MLDDSDDEYIRQKLSTISEETFSESSIESDEEQPAPVPEKLNVSDTITPVLFYPDFTKDYDAKLKIAFCSLPPIRKTPFRSINGDKRFKGPELLTSFPSDKACSSAE